MERNNSQINGHVFEPRIQQDDNYREFLGWITDGGLRYAYARYSGAGDQDRWYRRTLPAPKRKNVIVVGAGVGGLVAAYELAQIGHKVTILEAKDFAGGRVQTLREGFTDGLYGEAGALRIPDNHFLTRTYVDHFRLAMEPFQYYNPDAFLYIQGEKVRQKDWKRYNGFYCDKWWPGWDGHISMETKQQLNINGILDLWQATIAPLKAELGTRPSEEQWQKWIKKWCRFNLEEFLLSEEYQDSGPKLRPWPKAAIDAFKTSRYWVVTSFSLVHYLRNELGRWWSDPMTQIVGGMDTFPRAFLRPNTHGWNTRVDLSQNIKYGVRVESVQTTTKGVKVEGLDVSTNNAVSYEGDAVFLTIPLNVLRHIDLPISDAKKQAMSNLITDKVTRILLQCRTRFWEKEQGKGGYCKTDLPFGQMVYPDWLGSKTDDQSPAILTVYIRGTKAHELGELPEKELVKQVVDEIKEIHPEIIDNLETARVHVWNNEPTIQAAFSVFSPQDYMRSQRALSTPTERNVYIASDTMSWCQSCCSWMQGALFSALMQAFCFTFYCETEDTLCPVNLLKGSGCAHRQGQRVYVKNSKL